MQSYITTLRYHQLGVQEGDGETAKEAPQRLTRTGTGTVTVTGGDSTTDGATHRQAPSLFASTAGMKRDL